MQRVFPLAIAAAFFATSLVAHAEDQQQTAPAQAPPSGYDMTRHDMGGGMGNGTMAGQAQGQQQSAPRGRGTMSQEMMGGMMGNQDMMAQMMRMMENCNRMMESQMQNQHGDDAQPQPQPDRKD